MHNISGLSFARQALKTKAELVLLEDGIMGIDHCEVGAYIAGKWRIPEFLRAAMLHHHRPRFSEIETEFTRSIAAVVHVADAVVSNRGITPGFPCTTSMNDDALRIVSLKNSTIEEIFDTVETDLKTVMADWGIR